MFEQNNKSDLKTFIKDLSIDQKNLADNEKIAYELSEEEQSLYVGGATPASCTRCNDVDCIE